MKAAIVSALAALTLAACAPPGMDPEASEQIRQKHIAKVFGDDKPAEAKPAEEEAAETPAPPPPIVNPPAEGITVTGISLSGYWRGPISSEAALRQVFEVRSAGKRTLWCQCR